MMDRAASFDGSVDTTCPRSRRGGAFRKAVGPCDAAKLEQALVEYVRNTGVTIAFNFGRYDSILKTAAACGSGLAHNYRFLDSFLTAVPCGEISLTDLKNVLLHVTSKFDGMNSSGLSDASWIMLVSKRILTMLSHLRRIKQNSVKLTQAQQRCDMHQARTIENLLGKLHLLDHPGGARGLKRSSSECSVDSDGFPTMLAAPSPSPPQKKSAAAKDFTLAQLSGSDVLWSSALAAAPVPTKPTKRSELILQMQKGASAPEAPAVVAATPQKPKPKSKPPSTSSRKSDTLLRAGSSKKLGLLKMVYASKQSYIQMKDGSRWLLVVACSETMSCRHASIIDKLARAAVSKPLDKSQLLAMRADLVAK